MSALCPHVRCAFGALQPATLFLDPNPAAFIRKDAECRAVFVSSEQQLRKIQSVRPQALVEKVIVMDAVETNQAFRMTQLMHDGPVQRDPQLDARARAITPDDLATLIYT